jgi:hypothetical protein
LIRAFGNKKAVNLNHCTKFNTKLDGVHMGSYITYVTNLEGE